MSQIDFYRPGERVDDVDFVSAALRDNGRWVMARAPGETAWRLPVGGREADDSPEEAMLRAIRATFGDVSPTLHRVAIYRDGEKCGLFFLAEADGLSGCRQDGAFEVKCFDVPPYELFDGELYSKVFRVVNGWLCNMSGAGEMWDVYDSERRPTGRLHRRGDILAEGDYHIVVHVWMRNSKGEFLITKRSPNKGFPNMWETTGGSALAGDDSLTAALREVKEETGLSLDPARGRMIYTYRGSDYFVDVWLFEQDFDLDDVVLLEGETCDRMYAPEDVLGRLIREGLFFPYRYLDILFDRKVDE